MTNGELATALSEEPEGLAITAAWSSPINSGIAKASTRLTIKQFFKQTFGFGTARPKLNKMYPETAKLTYWFPSLFLIGLDASVFLAIFGHYFLVKAYSVYFLILLFDSFFKNGLKVAILCIITSFTQFLGYGLGFLESQFFNKK